MATIGNVNKRQQKRGDHDEKRRQVFKKRKKV
jgi:hypothetical protein